MLRNLGDVIESVSFIFDYVTNTNIFFLFIYVKCYRFIFFKVVCIVFFEIF